MKQNALQARFVDENFTWKKIRPRMQKSHSCQEYGPNIHEYGTESQC